MLLLDTNVIIWILEGDARLGRTTKRRLENQTKLLLSVVSVWEIRLKQRRHANFAAINFDPILNNPDLQIIALTTEQIETFHKLKKLDHNDPFDLMLLSVAINEGLDFLTSDQNLIDLDLPELTIIDSKK